jgi:hypothetical protein
MQQANLEMSQAGIEPCGHLKLARFIMKRTISLITCGKGKRSQPINVPSRHHVDQCMKINIETHANQR